MPSARILHLACTRASCGAEEARATAHKGIVGLVRPRQPALSPESKFARTLPVALSSVSRQERSTGRARRFKGKQMTTQTTSLYDRLGGLDAITALTESWVARVGGDDRANGKFVRTDLPRLKKEIIDQLCEAAGGPCTYTGRTMRETHDGMAVTAGEFDVAMQHLDATLDELNVPKTDRDELVALIMPMRGDIV